MLLAYKFVAASLLLAELNIVGPKLQIAAAFPIKASELRRILFTAPRHARPDAFFNPLMTSNVRGRLDVDNYSFAFSDRGQLSIVLAIKYLQKNVGINTVDAHFDENRALQLATNWLTELRVNTAALESDCEKRIQLASLKSPQIHDLFLPAFQIEWIKEKRTSVYVEIDARTRQLMLLRVEDESFLAAQRGLIKEREKLIATPDNEFLAYTPTQLRDLVKTFASDQNADAHLSDFDLQTMSSMIKQLVYYDLFFDASFTNFSSLASNEVGLRSEVDAGLANFATTNITLVMTNSAGSNSVYRR